MKPIEEINGLRADRVFENQRPGRRLAGPFRHRVCATRHDIGRVIRISPAVPVLTMTGIHRCEMRSQACEAPWRIDNSGENSRRRVKNNGSKCRGRLAPACLAEADEAHDEEIIREGILLHG